MTILLPSVFDNLYIFREEVEKKKQQNRSEANDLARLAIIRKQREEAAKKRVDEEKLGNIAIARLF